MSSDEENVQVKVSGAGHGIASENKNGIFEPFFTTKPLGKGVGLGVSVMYSIVKMHCGDIKVESNADPSVGPTGTTFI